MKNTVKRMLALVFAAVMVLAMTIPAAAADYPTNANLGVKRAENSTADFTAYEVLKATQVGVDSENKAVYKYDVAPDFAAFFDNATYGNYKFVDGAIKTSAGAEITSDGIVDRKDTAAAKLASMLEKFAVDNGLTGTAVADKTVSVEKGLYLVVETQTPADEKNGLVASKPLLVDVTSDKTDITPKADKITLTKKIGQDEAGEKKELTDDSQYILDANNKTVGDKINYRVESQFPTYKTDINETIKKDALKYEFSDSFTHIAFNEASMVVKVNNQVVTAGDTTYTLTKTTDGFKLAFVADFILAHQGEKVDLYYTGTLKADAVVNSTEGNPNTVTLTYSNNPNKANSYDTLKDDVKTFTYAFKIHKVDKDDDTKDLAGAQFVVKNAKDEEVGVFGYDDEGNLTVSGKVTTTGGGFAEVKGVDEGTYTIEETVAPKDYSLISAPVKVTITDEGGKTTPTGKATIKVEAGSGGDAVVEVGTSAGNGQIDLIVKIKDSKGISLPETGAMSALYCMIGGFMLLALGGLFLAFVKRTNK